MNLQWIIFVVVLVVLIQGWLFKHWALKGLQYTRFFSSPAVFQGQDVEMVEWIVNHKLLPIPWLRVESKINENLEFSKQFNLDIKHQQFHKSLFTLMPYMKITRRHKVHCKKRGCYFLNSVALTCGDLFGVQEVSCTYSLSVRLLVYPSLIPLDKIPFSSHSWMGDIVVKRWIVEDPFMYSGVREYRSGDPLNNINWKATARVGKLQVHKKDYTANPRLMIYLNLDITEEMWDAVTEPERIEKGISYAASIAQYAISNGIDTGFGCNGYLIDEPGHPVRILPRSGMSHLTYLFEVMARLVIERQVTFYTFLEEDIVSGITGTDFLFITSYISERMENQIAKLRERGNAVEILYLEPADLSYGEKKKGGNRN
jgi:uncharacterized protein (DUF58 family)